MIKRLAKLPIRALLNQSLIRRTLAFELKQNYFADLGIVVPLGWSVQCPVTRTEHWCSFEEIFFKGEYEGAMESLRQAGVSLPSKWLDIGCHAGYFSLWLYWQHRKSGNALPNIQALLVDGDKRVQTSVERIVSLNNLEGQLKFLCGIISSGTGKKKFATRSHMASNVVSDTTNETTANLAELTKVITEHEILKELSEPYDLVKVDIEGGEYEFLTHYKNLLSQARFLILEWHGWHNGGGGAKQIRDLAEEQGFKLIYDSHSGHYSQTCGLFVFNSSQ